LLLLLYEGTESGLTDSGMYPIGAEPFTIMALVFFKILYGIPSADLARVARAEAPFELTELFRLVAGTGKTRSLLTLVLGRLEAMLCREKLSALME